MLWYVEDCDFIYVIKESFRKQLMVIEPVPVQIRLAYQSTRT